MSTFYSKSFRSMNLGEKELGLSAGEYADGDIERDCCDIIEEHSHAFRERDDSAFWGDSKSSDDFKKPEKSEYDFDARANSQDIDPLISRAYSSDESDKLSDFSKKRLPQIIKL